MRRVLPATALIAALLLASSAAPAPADAATPAVVLGATHGAAVTVTTDPVGLSIEYPLLARDLGDGPCPPPALIGTLQALGSPTIRIGGDSQDQTAPAGTAPFPGVSDLPATFWTQLACLEAQTGEPIVVGLNVASGMPVWADEMATAARAAIPAGRLSFELGNEPDVYGVVVPWWNGTALVYSPMPFATYIERAQALETQIGPLTDIEGPDLTGARWVAKIPQIAQALSLQTIDTHLYPLNVCTQPARVTVAALLARGAAAIDGPLSETLALARSAHLPIVVSEANSVGCSGKPGVSDSPASAVWALRLIVNAVHAGISSVRFHSSGSSYDPFVVNGTTVTTRPLYQALQAAVDLLPIGAVVRRLVTPHALAGVRVTAPNGAVTYIVTNYAAGPAEVAIAARHGGEVLRVSASGPTVTYEHVHSTAGMATLTLAPATVVAITLTPANG
ncbi:MAG: hypothetical protein ABSG64_05330 [Solirubrobacteraceae bacterium]